MMNCCIKSPVSGFQPLNLKVACSTILFAATVLTSGLVHAKQDNFLDTANEYLTVSGAAEEIAKFPQTLMGQVDQQLVQGGIFDMSDPAQAAIVNRLSGELSVLFTERNLKRAVINSLEDAVSVDSLNSAIAFYQSPVGKLSTQYEKESENVLEDPEFQRFSQQFGSMSKDKTRSELATRTVETYKLHEFVVDVGIDSQIASLMGMLDNVSEEFHADGSFRQQVQMSMENLNNMREPSYEGAFPVMVALQYYTYRDMMIEDFVEYSEFHATPEAVSVNHALLGGMKNFTVDALYVVGTAIADEMNKVRMSSVE